MRRLLPFLALLLTACDSMSSGSGSLDESSDQIVVTGPSVGLPANADGILAAEDFDGLWSYQTGEPGSGSNCYEFDRGTLVSFVPLCVGDDWLVGPVDVQLDENSMTLEFLTTGTILDTLFVSTITLRGTVLDANTVDLWSVVVVDLGSGTFSARTATLTRR